ncbi:hypothetical protein SAMN05421678_115199 [Actinopolymorpha cephalotaxi]|uniref:Uncharacterized protein n=1 Tax=Actinopolymorpha cephalotaxi TaxID=504797 RepID=A0A1I2Z5N0_9ACTN|nr:hypothetical protein [Actinopolymorpha cephalotaxi]NYH81880.1 hypothetical protein [Actinopolymorpha cephalotaxi]SFH33208.1 hypothetical protein SAMN05421678_115199 [Actinopolymorpha cephalotaxi]
MKTGVTHTPARGRPAGLPRSLVRGTADSARSSDRESARKPWVGRSYAHLVLPVPHLDERHRELLDRAVRGQAGRDTDHGDDGHDSGTGEIRPGRGDRTWQVVNAEADAEPGLPVLRRQWRHPGGDSLLLVVLGWYPLVVTVGPEQAASIRARRALRRVVDAARAAGARTLPDADLSRVLAQSRERWERAVALRQVIEERRTWLECRHCGGCGEWSAYGVLHCCGCARRFAPADDAERDERGRVAAEESARAERELAELGSGAGLFADWPARPDGGADRDADR